MSVTSNCGESYLIFLYSRKPIYSKENRTNKPPTAKNRYSYVLISQNKTVVCSIKSNAISNSSKTTAHGSKNEAGIRRYIFSKVGKRLLFSIEVPLKSFAAGECSMQDKLLTQFRVLFSQETHWRVG